jgi:hypothetical protein
MSGTTEQFEGGCLCRAVRFVATGQPKGVYWCHCQSCRKHSGAPVSVFVAFERSAYTVSKGEITKFDSTPGSWRYPEAWDMVGRGRPVTRRPFMRLTPRTAKAAPWGRRACARGKSDDRGSAAGIGYTARQAD